MKEKKNVIIYLYIKLLATPFYGNCHIKLLLAGKNNKNK